ncbi:MAG: arylsulfatase [Candidatus Hydrogenedentota bacterium]
MHTVMRSRRDFLKSAVAATLAASTMRSAAPEASSLRPNIVFILADDMGFGDMACQNPESKIPTPNLDRLATQGMRFTDAHSSSAVCSPTRYSILTGEYAWRSRLKEHVLWTWDEPLIDRDRWTIGHMLRDQGYTTACIGKWHLGWHWPTADGSRVNDMVAIGKSDPAVRDPFGWKVDFAQPIGEGPTTRGFHYYFGDDVPNFAPYCFIENDRVTAIPTVPKPDAMFGTPGPMVEGWKLDAVMPAITQKAVDFIKAKPGDDPFNKIEGPFFLYFPLTAPHTPVAPAAEFIGKSMAHRYGDYVCQVDDTVGRVMQALEETGQVENTILIFTSDNGSPARDGENMNGEVGSLRRFGHNPSHIFRGIKADIWEGGHRVPFVVRWPGHVPEGEVSDELICSMDLAATLAAITGYVIPEGAAGDSCNMLAAFEGTNTAPIREALVHHSVQGMFAIRKGPWKYIEGKGSGGWSGPGQEGDPPGQLYDMASDPGETKNLFSDEPELVKELQELLDAYRSRGNSRHG